MNEVIKHYDELIIKYDKEVMRLNNIINELEKIIIQRIKRIEKAPIREKARNDILYNLNFILKQLKELKGE